VQIRSDRLRSRIEGQIQGAAYKARQRERREGGCGGSIEPSQQQKRAKHEFQPLSAAMATDFKLIRSKEYL
jgi:hypothetical protein